MELEIAFHDNKDYEVQYVELDGEIKWAKSSHKGLNNKYFEFVKELENGLERIFHIELPNEFDKEKDIKDQIAYRYEVCYTDNEGETHSIVSHNPEVSVEIVYETEYGLCDKCEERFDETYECINCKENTCIDCAVIMAGMGEGKFECKECNDKAKDRYRK